MTQSPRRRPASSPFAAPATVVPEVYVVGERVSHDGYGLGRVISVEGETSTQVDFGSGARHIALPCRAMTAL